MAVVEVVGRRRVRRHRAAIGDPRVDARDLLRDDDARALPYLDHTRLCTVEIAVHDLGTEKISELLDVDGDIRGECAENRGRLERPSPDRGVTSSFGCFLVSRLLLAPWRRHD